MSGMGVGYMRVRQMERITSTIMYMYMCKLRVCQSLWVLSTVGVRVGAHATGGKQSP